MTDADRSDRAPARRAPSAVSAGEIARRLRMVERVMQEHGWSLTVVQRLAAELGVSERTVRRYRATVVRDLAEDPEGDPAEHRGDFLLRLRHYQREAASSGNWGSVASMMRIEASVTGITEPLTLKVQHSASMLDGVSDNLLEVIASVEERRAAGEAISEDEQRGLALLLGDGESADVLDVEADEEV